MMFSAKAQDMDRNTGLLVGADDYLTKPAAPADIVSHVEALLAKKEQATTGQEKTSG